MVQINNSSIKPHLLIFFFSCKKDIAFDLNRSMPDAISTQMFRNYFSFLVLLKEKQYWLIQFLLMYFKMPLLEH